jgi:hypothetical protein
MPKRPGKAAIQKKIKQSLEVLIALGLPRPQLNERSALTLLALLDLKPSTPWREAGNPMMGITPMMDYFAEYYGKKYAPNTRETVRRQTVHQFLQAGLIVANPDDPNRPTNSPKAVYQIGPSALKMLREYSSPTWSSQLRGYLKSVKTLKKLYAQERAATRIPISIPAGRGIKLSPGAHNTLVKKIITDFCAIFTPGALPIYVGDTQKKWAYFDEETLRKLGVHTEEHGKMPDAVVYWAEKNWMILIEAVTSHGPVNPKRRQELKDLFAGSLAPPVYVTAFPDRKAMVKYLSEISWETEVWIAESPTHLIHFNGERFLGPYEE